MLACWRAHTLTTAASAPFACAPNSRYDQTAYAGYDQGYDQGYGYNEGAYGTPQSQGYDYSGAGFQYVALPVGRPASSAWGRADVCCGRECWCWRGWVCTAVLLTERVCELVV